MNTHEEAFEKARNIHSREQEKAFDRIREVAPAWSFDESILHWILKFISSDLEDLSAAEWEQKRFEINAIAQFGPEAEGLRVHGRWPHSAVNDLPDHTDWIRYQLADELPSKITIHMLQDEIRQDLERIYIPQGAMISLPASTLTLRFMMNINDRRNGARVKEYREVYSGLYLSVSLPIGFRYHIFEALRRYPERLRHCRACKKPFFAIRKHKEYCSDQCRARTYNREENEIPPERFGKRGRPLGTKGKIKASLKTNHNKGGSHGKKAR